MKRRNFIQAVASTTVAAGLGDATRSAPKAILNPPVMELRVALTTQAFDRLASFYRAGLGMEPSQVWPEEQGRALVLDMGKATLEVFDEKQAQTVDQIEVGRRVSGQIRFALQVPDLDAAMKRLQAHGATLVHGPVVAPWGDKTVRFQDPDGMQITLYQVRGQS
jgi:catechol 2,3-dioxygenase-like lactoylglutathione lyase family enzyme